MTEEQFQREVSYAATDLRNRISGAVGSFHPGLPTRVVERNGRAHCEQMWGGAWVMVGGLVVCERAGAVLRLAARSLGAEVQ